MGDEKTKIYEKLSNKDWHNHVERLSFSIDFDHFVTTSYGLNKNVPTIDNRVQTLKYILINR